MRLEPNCISLSHWSRAIVNKFIDNKNDVPCNTTLAMSEKKFISYKQLQNWKYANILNFESKQSTTPRGYVHRGRHLYDQQGYRQWKVVFNMLNIFG